MDMRYILGNWKSHKTIAEAREWKAAFVVPQVPHDVTVIVTPAFHHIPIFEGVSYALGVENLSPFDSGAYTGEVSAAMVKDTVRYALLGHSERRKYFAETDELVSEKVKRAREQGIIPIVCVSEEAQVNALARLIPDYAKDGMLLYEPLFAIGSGTADTPENADAAAASFRNRLEVPILYGGSVTPENVKGFVSSRHIAGVGVGGASLDAATFSKLISSAV